MNPKELNEIIENIRKRVNRYLKRHGISVKKLASDCELSPQLINQLINGEKNSCNVSSLIKLAHGMKTEPYKLLVPMK